MVIEKSNLPSIFSWKSTLRLHFAWILIEFSDFATECVQFHRFPCVKQRDLQNLH